MFLFLYIFLSLSQIALITKDFFCTVARWFLFERAYVCVRAWMSECKTVEREKHLNCTVGWRYRWPDFYSTRLYERMSTTSHFAIYFLVSFAPVHYLIFDTVAYRPFSCDWAMHSTEGIGPNRRLAFWNKDRSPTVVCFFVLRSFLRRFHTSVLC